MIFHYAFLVDIDFVPDGEIQVMTFEFTNCVLTLKGYRLGLMVDEFKKHLPQQIDVRLERYRSLHKNECYFIKAEVLKFREKEKA